MNDLSPDGFAPRTVAAARTRRAIALKLLMRKGLLRLKRWLRRYALPSGHEMHVLRQADERVPKDAGLIRGEAAVRCRRASASKHGQPAA